MVKDNDIFPSSAVIDSDKTELSKSASSTSIHQALLKESHLEFSISEAKSKEMTDAGSGSGDSVTIAGDMFESLNNDGDSIDMKQSSVNSSPAEMESFVFTTWASQGLSDTLQLKLNENNCDNIAAMSRNVHSKERYEMCGNASQIENGSAMKSEMFIDSNSKGSLYVCLKEKKENSKPKAVSFSDNIEIFRYSPKVEDYDSDILKDQIPGCTISPTQNISEAHIAENEPMKIGTFDNGYYIGDDSSDEELESQYIIMERNSRNYLESIQLPLQKMALGSDYYKPYSKSVCENSTGQFRRNLSFENLIIGDSYVKDINPTVFDPLRTTYVKTIPDARIVRAVNFIHTTNFLGVKKIILHFGSYDLNEDTVSVCDLVDRIEFLICETQRRSPNSTIYFSTPFPRFDYDDSPMRTEMLNSKLFRVLRIYKNLILLKHENIIRDPQYYFKRGKFLSPTGVCVFVRNLKTVVRMKGAPSLCLFNDSGEKDTQNENNK